MRRRQFLIGGALTTLGTPAAADIPPYPAPSGPPGAPFSDVNFKLMVLSALSSQGVIDLGRPPALANHILGRPLDMSSEAYDVVPAVLDYLARYPLTADHLAKVETLTLDGGSGIYHHIFHFWHGEDDRFDPRSLEGIEQLSNLRHLAVASMIPMVDIAMLVPLRHLQRLEIGVDVTNVAALLEIETLRHVQILDDTIYKEVTTPGHPTRKIMDALKARGVRVWVHWVSSYDQSPAFE